jgi:hypothetical protein
MLCSEFCSFSLGALHGSLKDAGGISKLQLVNGRKYISVCKERFLSLLFNFIILDLSVDASLGLVVNPLTYEEFVLIMVKVRALPFTHVVDPVTLEMITVSLCKDSVAVAFSLVPLTFIDVFVGINHSAFSLRHSGDPVAVVSVAVLIEESAATVFLIFVPVTCILATQFASFIAPVSSLTMALIFLPQSFVLVAVFIELDAESVLLVLLPVADVSGSVHPLFSLDAAILLSLLLLDPVD